MRSLFQLEKLVLRNGLSLELELRLLLLGRLRLALTGCCVEIEWLRLSPWPSAVPLGECVGTK